MNTVILYATKHGTAEEIAKRLGAELGASLINLKTTPSPDISAYDTVVVGGSLYAGRLVSEAKKYLAAHQQELARKNLGVFLTGLADSDSYFKSNVPAKLFETAKTVFLSGVYDPAKCNALERFIMRIITRSKVRVDLISDEKIRQFAEEMKRE